MSCLVVAEHDNFALKSATLNTITAAQEVGDDVHVFVAGQHADGVAEAAARVAGVVKVLHADGPHFDSPTAENLAAVIVSVAGPYSHILLPATVYGKNIAPRVAALLDVAQVSDIIVVEAPDIFVRPIYAGTALATLQSTDAKVVITVRPTAFGAAMVQGGRASIQPIVVPVGDSRSQVLGQERTKSNRPDLTSARVVVSGGRGLQSRENFALLEALAGKLHAAVGASRAAVDAGYVSNDYQIGQTGKIVAPDLYLAIGISGAIQHLAGMKDSKVIVAINKDSEAPIFDVADYGLVGDLFEIVPQLIAELG